MNQTPPAARIQSMSVTALIGAFVALLCLPALDSCLNIDHTPTPNEKRILARWPEYEGLPQLGNFMAGLENYYNDHFGFRKQLVQWNSHWKFRLFSESPVDMAMVGREGWLFWAEDRMVENYCGRDRLSRRDLNDWQLLLETRRDWLARSGCKYLFVIPPDKHSVYPETLPAWLVKGGQPSKLDQLLAHMRAHSTVQVLDLRPALLETKKTAAVYFQTDTHWNAFGGFVACQELVRALSGQLPGLRPLPLEAFDRQLVTGRGGDLAVCLQQENSLRETKFWRFTPRPPLQPLERIDIAEKASGATAILTRNPNGSGKAVVFRDSFADAWIPFLGYDFAEVLYVRHYDWNEKLLAKEKPDVVIDEMVERKFNTGNPKDLMPRGEFAAIAAAR
jgi:alginate O-acetyltransferase complex protein AlgJ